MLKRNIFRNVENFKVDHKALIFKAYTQVRQVVLLKSMMFLQNDISQKIGNTIEIPFNFLYLKILNQNYMYKMIYENYFFHEEFTIIYFYNIN